MQNMSCILVKGKKVMFQFHRLMVILFVFWLCMGCSVKDQEIVQSSPNSSQDQEAIKEQSSVELTESKQKVIYGEDTRQDVYELTEIDLEQRAKRSILAMFNSDSLRINGDDTVSVLGSTLGRQYRLCNDQRYRNQVTGASCSATLIDNDIIVTAGHCVETQAECQSKRFVLGYYMESANNLAPIRSEQVFNCAQLLSQINTTALDYAFIRLDRPVPQTLGEPAAVVQNAAPVVLNEPLVMMGFPSGLPLKVDAGGFVSDPRGSTPPLNYFRATVDAFGGNSGSGVFNSQGEQVGISVIGETDYVSSSQRCTVVNVLNQDRGPGEDAEEITYLSRALSALCDSGVSSERLCPESQGGLCFDCEQQSDCNEGYQCGRFERYPDAPRFCAPACMADEDCPNNHLCVLNQCTPLETRACDGNQVVANDACGRRLGLVQTCGENEYCRRGACLPTSAGDQCESALLLSGSDETFQGSMQEGFTSSSMGSCGGEGPEVFYQLNLDQPNRLIATAQGYDTVLYLRSSCSANDELACVDDSRPPGRYGSRIDQRLEAGQYFIGLDSFDNTEQGTYRLEIDLCDQVCSLGEQVCDSQGNVERCSVNSQGCVVWQNVEECRLGAVCNEGRCVLPEAGDVCLSAEEIQLNQPTISLSYEHTISEQYTLSLGSQCSPLASFDRLYRFELEQASILSAELIGSATSAIALYNDCTEEPNQRTELSCTPNLTGSSGLNERLAPGTYTLVVTSERESEYTLNLSFVADCTDACDLSLEPYCDEITEASGLNLEVVRECRLGLDGCTQLVINDECRGRVCAGGLCQEECFNSCTLGEQSCVGQATVISCVADERNCAFWSEVETCEVGQICAGDGICVAQGSDWGLPDEAGIEAGSETLAGLDLNEEWTAYGGPKERIIPLRSRGGCDQSNSRYPSFAFYFMLLALVQTRKKLI